MGFAGMAQVPEHGVARPAASSADAGRQVAESSTEVERARTKWTNQRGIDAHWRRDAAQPASGGAAVDSSDDANVGRPTATTTDGSTCSVSTALDRADCRT